MIIRSDTRQWSIYILQDSERDFYVGRTLQPRERLLQHRKRFGNHIVMRIVETGFGHSAAGEAERRWLETLSSDGIKLLNKVQAGSGAWITTEETLKKMR